VTILDALDDPQLFGPAFTGGNWTAWRAFLATLYGLPLPPGAAGLVNGCTGRPAASRRTPAREAWVVVGRRGGKSRIAALVAVFTAALHDWGSILAPGERGTVPLIAADRRQARTLMRYVQGLIHGCPMLARMVERETADSIDLTNRCTIEIHTASWRGLRGYTVCGAVLDEVAFWRSDESANPDREIVNALRPAMATVPGALLLAISSPYARRGILWDTYKRHYGKAGDVLVWQAPTRVMNPSVPQSLIDAAMDEDEAAAVAEYGAEFRRDVESFVSREVVDAATVPGRRELPPVAGVTYEGFVDPSGGSADSFSLAIAHQEQDGAVVLDAVREVRPPFSPETVCKDFAGMLKAYRCTRVAGDRYAGEWPREQFQKHGVTYEPSERTKSELYGAVLPLLNSGRVRLLDVPRLSAQLLGLERRTSRGGRDSIDHGPHGRDDVSNAAAGALVAAAMPMGTGIILASRLSSEPVRRLGLSLLGEPRVVADYSTEHLAARSRSRPWDWD